MAKPYWILSCDGGGIRGLLTAYLLQELDRASGFLSKVDLFAGTSTGGILALGLAGGVKIEKLIDLYKTKANKIFQRVPMAFAEKVLANTAAKAVEAFLRKKKPDLVLADHSPEKMFAVKYTNAGLLDAVRELFPTDPLLTGLSRNVLVTTFRLDSPDSGWRPVTLHNLIGQADPPIASHIVESAMCTSAAPTYFEPYKHMVLGYCVDGGMFANNPGSLAIAAAVRAGNPINTLSVLSVGTGGLIARFPFEKMSVPPQYLGIFSWMWPKAFPKHQTPEMPLLAALFDGTSASDRIVCEGLLGNQYRRVQVPLTELIEMDDIDSIPKLQELAKAYFTTDSWQKTVSWVKQQLNSP